MRAASLTGVAVHLSKIYTRTGDAGTTRLADFSVTGKNDPRLCAYADVDEANAAIGVAVTMGPRVEPVAFRDDTAVVSDAGLARRTAEGETQ